jgi:hypothetical protein
MVLIGLRLDREVLWHEADLHVRSYAAFEVSVENAIEKGPVIHGLPLSPLPVSAGGTPFEGRRSIARREQIVGAEVNASEFAEFGEQLLAVLHVGVVRLVRAEEAPDRL